MEHCLLAVLPFLVSLTWHRVQLSAWATDPNTSRLSLVQVEALANPKMFTKPPAHHPQMQKLSKLLRYIHGMMLDIYFSIMQGLKQNHKVFFWILIELLNLHVWSGGETHRRRAWLHRFLFHHGSSSVNHTLLQQFSTKLLFNTSLQHSSPTLLFDALSDLLLPQPSSPTLVYNIASRSKLVLIPDAKIHKLFYMNKFSNRRLFKCKSTQNGWFIMENPIKMGWFGGTPIFGNIHIPLLPKRLLLPAFLLGRPKTRCETRQTSRGQELIRLFFDPPGHVIDSYGFLWFIYTYKQNKTYSIHILWYNPYSISHYILKRNHAHPCTETWIIRHLFQNSTLVVRDHFSATKLTVPHVKEGGESRLTR